MAAPPHNFPPTLHGQIQNVLAGWTADGFAAPFEPTTLSSVERANVDTVAKWVLAFQPNPAPDLLRTTAIRKAIPYVRQHHSKTPIDFAACAAVVFFTWKRPDALESALAFSDCETLYLRRWAARPRRNGFHLSAEDLA